MYVRVRDPETGHQFDVPETDPRIGTLLVAVDRRRWPPSPLIRHPKHHVKLAGRTASRETAAAPVVAEPQDATAPTAEAPEKE